MLFSVFIVYRTQYATHGREVRRWHTVSAKTLYIGELQSPCPVLSIVCFITISVGKIFAWSPAVLVAVIFERLYDLRELHEMGSFYQNGVTLHQQQRQRLEESLFCIKVFTDKLTVRIFCMYAFY